MNELAPRPSQPSRPIPYGLVTRWDMLRFSIQKFVSLGEKVHEAKLTLDRENGVAPGPIDEGLQELYEALAEMVTLSRRIGAKKCADLIHTQIEHFEHGVRPRSWEEVDILADTFKKELEERHFFYMPIADAEYYQNNSLLKPAAKKAFPKLTQELRSAGNAHACGLPTACVFHSMRALEHALGALARAVGLKWEKEQWHTIIEQIEARIKHERQTLPMGLVKDARLPFLSEAAKQFMYFKDGWRNYVAHNRVSYEPSQALEVLDHVRAFAEILSANLKE